MKYCAQSDNTRWVCEAHPDRPWVDSPRGCQCGAPGDPCPVCDRADEDTEPELPEGFAVDKRRSIKDFD